jgi:prepilin-type N-terminal cleavage/methylation domain-containing protein
MATHPVPLNRTAADTRHPTGFTLVELLIVVAIVSLLAAIMFPVFAQARQKARQSRCLSNLRQIGAALLVYSHDYDERFPAECWAPPVNGGDFANMPYDQQILPYFKNDSLFQCPDDTTVRRGDEVWDGRYKSQQMPRSYAPMGRLSSMIRRERSDSHCPLSSLPQIPSFLPRHGEAFLKKGV